MNKVKQNLENGPRLHFRIGLILVNINETIISMNKYTEQRKQNLFEVDFNLVLEVVKAFTQRRPNKGFTSKTLQKIKLVLGENVVELSIDTALLLIFPPLSEKTSV